MTNAELKAIVQREEYDFLHTNKHLGSNILFLTLSGSHAYGTNVEGSDIDIRGVAGSPEILGFNRFEQAIDKPDRYSHLRCEQVRRLACAG